MSGISFVVLVLVLVFQCFSFHACNARHIGVVHGEYSKPFGLPSKNNDQKTTYNRVPIQPNENPSSPNTLKQTENPKQPIADQEKKINVEGDKINASSKIKSKSSSGSISWRWPQKKTGEQEPGFNLDYLPPKTHPPVHN